ncbi:MAG: YdcH family protein [Pseudomonadota bacterium]
MAHTPHELAEDFPGQADKIHELKMNDAHFARLADEYHTVNREVHRVETGVEAASQEREEELRKTRMRLKDEIAAILSKA